MPSKLVTGEGKDFETLLSILLVQVCQLTVVVCSHASLGCDIYKDDDLFLCCNLADARQLAINIYNLYVLERCATHWQLLLSILEYNLRYDTSHNISKFNYNS